MGTGAIAVGGLPVTTDGGTMAFSHAGRRPSNYQRVIRGVPAAPRRMPHLPGPRGRGGHVLERRPGALFTDVLLLGPARP